MYFFILCPILSVIFPQLVYVFLIFLNLHFIPKYFFKDYISLLFIHKLHHVLTQDIQYNTCIFVMHYYIGRLYIYMQCKSI